MSTATLDTLAAASPDTSPSTRKKPGPDPLGVKPYSFRLYPADVEALREQALASGDTLAHAVRCALAAAAGRPAPPA